MIERRTEQVKVFCGVDPALVNIGFCCVQSPKIEPRLIHCSLFGAERLAFIYREILSLVAHHKPALVAIEDYSFNSIARQHALGEAGGVIKLAVHHAGSSFITVAPKQLKLFVAGSGGASKARMIRSVNKKYNLKITNDDLADATGLAKIAELYAEETESSIRTELEVIARLRKKYEKNEMLSSL